MNYSILAITVMAVIVVIGIGALFLKSSKGRRSRLRLKIGSPGFMLVDLQIDLK